LPGWRSPGRPKGTRATTECVGNLPRPDFTNRVVFVPKPVLDPETGEVLPRHFTRLRAGQSFPLREMRL
jgi:hypothetical protein